MDCEYKEPRKATVITPHGTSSFDLQGAPVPILVDLILIGHKELIVVEVEDNHLLFYGLLRS